MMKSPPTADATAEVHVHVQTQSYTERHSKQSEPANSALSLITRGVPGWLSF